MNGCGMPETFLQKLQQLAAFAIKSQSIEEGISQLSSAFALFSEEANRMQSVHEKLQERFAHVNRELEQILQLLDTVLKNISEVLLFIDLNGVIIRANGAAERLFAKDLLLQRFWDLFPNNFFGFSMREALNLGITPKLFYKTILSKEFEISTFFIYEGAKEDHGLIVLLRDLSEKRQLQEMAARGDRMRELGEMAATVAHEIRNPLGAVRGFASLLYRDLAAEKSLQEMAGSILEGTYVLERLVSSILHYARPLQIAIESTDLGALLKKIGRFIKMDASFPPHVQLEMHVPDTLLLAPIDPAALKSALLNLLFNALQAMPYGGTLTLSLLKGDASYQIAISDTGIGMDETELNQLFSPFFTTKKKGNGLGLVETQKIVQAHQGTIEVRSQVGKGTTVTLTLPLKR